MPGKLLALLGGLLAIVAIALFYIAPSIGAWWTTSTSVGGTVTSSMSFGGFSSYSYSVLSVTEASIAMDMYLILEAILVIVGALIAILGALKESKGLGMLGGLLILLGPILLIVALSTGLGVFENYLSAYSALGGGSLIMGSYEFGTITFNYGLQVGAFLLIAAGVLGLIGGMTIESD